MNVLRESYSAVKFHKLKFQGDKTLSYTRRTHEMSSKIDFAQRHASQALLKLLWHENNLKGRLKYEKINFSPLLCEISYLFLVFFFEILENS